MACKECREEFGTGEVRIGEAGTERTGGSWSGLVSPALERSGQAGEERQGREGKDKDGRVEVRQERKVGVEFGKDDTESRGTAGGERCGQIRRAGRS